jgi:hypothetical protein
VLGVGEPSISKIALAAGSSTSISPVFPSGVCGGVDVTCTGVGDVLVFGEVEVVVLVVGLFWLCVPIPSGEGDELAEPTFTFVVALFVPCRFED